MCQYHQNQQLALAHPLTADDSFPVQDISKAADMCSNDWPAADTYVRAA